MDFDAPFRVAASGLAAQRKKMDVIINNIANIDTTRTPEGGPYRRKVAVFSSESLDNSFDNKLKEILRVVKVERIHEASDEEGFKVIFSPGHPDADSRGFLSVPNINLATEMMDMILASRAYEACVTAFDASKNMALKTIDIGR